MNKKTRKLKKNIKRNLKLIGFKKSCKTLKNNFLSVFKTAIYDSSYFNEENPSNFHPAWRVQPQPLIEEIGEDGIIVTNSECFLPLNIAEAATKILWHKKFNVDFIHKNNKFFVADSKVLISCYNFQYMDLEWTTI